VTNQMELFPDMSYEAPEPRKSPIARPLRWYYIEATTGQRMMSCDPFTGEVIYISLDLACPRIMLFNSRAIAQRQADQFDGEVHLYPYNLDHFFSR